MRMPFICSEHGGLRNPSCYACNCIAELRTQWVLSRVMLDVTEIKAEAREEIPRGTAGGPMA